MRVDIVFISLIVSQMFHYGNSEFSNVSFVSFDNVWFQVIRLDCQIYRQK